MLYILVVLLFFPFVFCAQTTEQLSLEELDSLAYHYSLTYQVDSSNHYLSRALDQSADLPKDSLYIKRMSILAANYINTGNAVDGQATLTTAFKLWDSQYENPSPIYASLLSSQAVVYIHRGVWSKADSIITKMRNILEPKFQYDLTYGYACYLTAYMGIQTNKPAKYIEPYYRKAYNIFKKHLGAFHPESLSALNGLADFYSSQNKYEKSVELYQQVIDNYPHKNNTQYPLFLTHLAYTYQEMNRYEEAEVLYLQAIKTYKITKNTKNSQYANLLNNLGHFYLELTEYQQAKSFLEEAKDLYLTLGNEFENYLYVLNNLALVYHYQKQYQQAQAIYEQCVAYCKKEYGSKSLAYAIATNNLAGMYIDLGNLAIAEGLFLEVIPIFKQQKDDQTLAVIYHNLGNLYLQRQDYSQAQDYTTKALLIREQLFGQRHSSVASSLNSFADLYYQQKNNTLALKYSIQSIVANSPTIDSSIELSTLIEEITNHQYYSNKIILNSLKELYQILQTPAYQKNNDAALQLSHQLCKQTVLLIGQQQNNRLLNEDKLQLAQNSSFFVGELIKTAIALSEQQQNPSHMVNALYYMEHNKTLLLTDALKAQRARNFGGLPDSLALKELRLQEQKDELQQLLLTSTTEEDIQYFQTTLNETNLEIEDLKQQLQEQFPKYFKIRYAPIFAKVSDLQPILTEGLALLEYFIADSAIYLFYIDAKDFQIHPISVSPTELQAKVKDLRLALSDYIQLTNKPEESKQLYTQTAHWFYEKLLAPALQHKKSINHLIIIPDGELGHLPFETFLTAPNTADAPYANLSYLLNKYSVSYDYSATMFKENMTATTTQTPNNHLLGIAASYDNPSSPDYRAAHLKALRKPLKPLPATIHEINALAKQFNGVFAKGKQANEHFFKEQAPRFGIIHLAMHGILNKHYPILSGLAFTETNDSLEDNFLQAYEISHLKLNAALVVLSACETGYGKFQRGEGVMSLARSFMYAGVPSLVVSLWQINDQATAMLMKDFYAQLLATENKAVALRQAKLQFIKNAKGISAHPAFWSALIQLGNYQPIQIQKKTSYWWYISIVLGLGIGYASLRFRSRTKVRNVEEV